MPWLAGAAARYYPATPKNRAAARHRRRPSGERGRSVIARRSRSIPRPLALLGQPLFASQQRLLTVDRFRRAAEDRGLRLDRAELEVLHREGLLVPFFGIRYDPRVVRSRHPTIRREEMRALLDFTATGGEELRCEQEVGDLFDPSTEPFVSYRQLRGTHSGRPYQRVKYVYSPYQLLQLRSIRQLLPAMRWRGRFRRLKLTIGDRQRLQFQFAERHNRALLVPLHAVETIYWPAVIESVRAPDVRIAADDPFRAWDELRHTFDPGALLKWIGWDAAEVASTAERLLLDGRWIDPLKEWEDLVAVVRPERWLQLRGDALMAVDHKIAAEMLLRFYEELVERGAAPALEPLGRWRAPRHSRLTRDRATLQEVLTLYDLSPHPSVLLVVEGATEALIMPRVLDLLSSSWRNYIEVVDAEGVTRALDPLIAYAATPRLLRDEGRGVLMRPPVRVLIAMDPEGPYVTRQQRERRRQEWIARIRRALPERYRTVDFGDQLRELVEVKTWTTTGLSFEFAHWSDRQLAGAILAQSPNPSVTLTKLATSVAGCRARRRGIDSIWNAGWPSPHPKKPAIADALWPSLERRIVTDRERPLARVPALRVARRTLELARRSPRYLIHQLRIQGGVDG